jgi:hypothetical protein
MAGPLGPTSVTPYTNQAVSKDQFGFYNKVAKATPEVESLPESIYPTYLTLTPVP